MSQSSPSSPSGSPSQQFETAAIHVGHDWRDQTGAVIPPVYLTSTFEYGNEGGFDYTRSGNPNFRNLQQTLAALEAAATPASSPAACPPSPPSSPH
nr:PLP-dependent transferase [Verrucomicrobium spinosum]